MLSRQAKTKIKSILPRSIFEALSAVRRYLYAEKILEHSEKKPEHLEKIPAQPEKIPEYDEKIPDLIYYVNYVSGKRGIEIGGPSGLFKHYLPLYEKIESLDGVNYSNDTLWEGKIEEGLTFNFYQNRTGRQFICEGTNLSSISDDCYDFVLSSNCLEHIANPLKALNEWKRILKDDGLLILVLPNKKSNFDHRRPTTSFEHIIEDYSKDISEYDLTHLEEILSLHDLSMDPPAGDIENFKKRSLNNYNNRGLHHHLYDLNVMTQMVEFLGFKCVLKNETYRNYFLLASKAPKPTQRNR